MNLSRVVVAIAVTAATVASAVDLRAAALPKGTIEIAPSLAFSHSGLSYAGAGAGGATTLTGSGLVGVCVSGTLELEGGLLVDHRTMDSPGATSLRATSFGVLGGVRVNLGGGGRLIPFVRGAAGVAAHSGNQSLGGRTSVFAPMLGAGLRLRIGDSAAVSLGVEYQHHTNAFGLEDLGANTIASGIGVSFFLRRHRQAPAGG